MRKVGSYVQLDHQLQEGEMRGGLEYKTDFKEAGKVYQIVSRMFIHPCNTHWYRVAEMWYAISDEMIV